MKQYDFSRFWFNHIHIINIMIVYEYDQTLQNVTRLTFHILSITPINFKPQYLIKMLVRVYYEK